MRNESEIPDNKLRSSQLSQITTTIRQYSLSISTFNQPAVAQSHASSFRSKKDQSSSKLPNCPIPNQHTPIIGQWAWALGDSYQERAIWNFRIIENNIFI